MKPAARLQGAIEILRAILLDTISTEKAILDWGRSHRFAGSSDRRAIHDTVYDVLRYYGTLTDYMQSSDPAFLVAGWLFYTKEQSKSVILDMFNGEKHSPKELPDDVLSRLNTNRPAPSSFEGKYNINQSLEEICQDSLQDKMDSVLSSLIPKAPLDMRVNLSHISLNAAFGDLEEAFYGTEFISMPVVPTLVRTYDALNITETELYQTGKIEIQDAAPQFACHLMAQEFKRITADNTGRILDYCAGGGGKSIALADLVDKRTEIVGSDISEIRLKQLKIRSDRANNKNIRIIANHRLNPTKGLFDMVLADSPCSGSGTWRRNILEKWTTTPAKIAEYNALQSDILSKSSQFVASSGLLVYMTCSLFRAENDAIIKDFLQKHNDFEVIHISQSWATKTEYGTSLNPVDHDTDGFYMCFLQKK
jgi:16S rRNA (cytosine967-C5)-methyltransferase